MPAWGASRLATATQSRSKTPRLATVWVAPTALEDLADLVRTRSLPTDTRLRFRSRVGQLRVAPESGSPLEGQWAGYRFLLGPWNWMLVIYEYDRASDRVTVVTVQDARMSSAATSHSPLGS